MFSAFCRTVLQINHYRSIFSNMSDLQADVETAFDELSHIRSESDLASPQHAAIELSESPACADISRFHDWDDQKGGEKFDEGYRDWRAVGRTALIITGTDIQPTASSESSTQSDDNFSHDGIDSNEAGPPPPEHIFTWIEGYNERQSTLPKTPVTPAFDVTTPKYEAWSPEKTRPSTNPQMFFDHEQDLLDSPNLHRCNSKQSSDLSSEPDMPKFDRALRTPERLLFLPDETTMHNAGSFESENPFGTGAEVELPRNDADATVTSPPSESRASDQDAEPLGNFEEDELTEEELNMLFVMILRRIVAAEGGLAALPDVTDDSEDIEAEDGWR